MRFTRLMPYIALLAVFVMAVQPSVDTDTWWHMRSGQWMVEQREFLKSDPFSLTRQGQEWIYPGWLSQIVLFTIFDHLSFCGLNLFTGLIVLAAFWILWGNLDGWEVLKAFVVLLAAVTSGLYWSARPQIFTLFLTSSSLLLLDRAKEGHRRGLWLMPLLMVIWVNLHGGFILGFILLAIYGLGEVMEAVVSTISQQRTIKEAMQERMKIISTLLGVGALCILASMINPHGPSILLYPLKTVSIGSLQAYIAEWQSPNFHSTEVQPFILLFFLTFIALGISNQRRFGKDYILVIVFGYMSLLAARNVGLFALVAAPIVSRNLEVGLQPLIDRAKSQKDLPEKWRQGINLILVSLLTVAGLLRIATQLGDEINIEHVKTQIPLGAFKYIQDHKPEGRLFNSYNWGGYVVWALYPDYLSFVDGRTDLFKDEILDKYLQAWLAEPGWEEYLNEWDIRWVLIENTSPLSKVLHHAGWEIQYRDDQAVILEMDSNHLDR